MGGGCAGWGDYPPDQRENFHHTELLPIPKQVPAISMLDPESNRSYRINQTPNCACTCHSSAFKARDLRFPWLTAFQETSAGNSENPSLFDRGFCCIFHLKLLLVLLLFLLILLLVFLLCHDCLHNLSVEVSGREFIFERL